MEVITVRVLPVIRLSSMDDSTTSPERQLDQITHAARAKDPDVVILDPVYDLDVSGAVSPFARPGLGPHLTDPAKVAAYDALFAAKLDRITRSLQDFVALVAWCTEHGKTLLSVSESLDLSTPNGRMAANTLAVFAEFERERMAERRREALVTLRKNGWWNGGVAPYGYRPDPDGPHWVLVPDPAQAAVVRRMAAAILDGRSASAVARDLDAGGIRPARGRAWTVSSVLFVLRNCVLYGQLRDNEQRPLYGPDGTPLALQTAILDRDTWQRVQTRLSAASFKKSGAVPTALLSGVAFCACGAKLYANQVSSVPRRDGTRRVYRKYRCAADCGEPQVRQAALDPEVTGMLLAAYGTRDVPERVDVAASDSAARLGEVARLITGLDAEYRTGRLPAAAYARQVAALEAEQADLEARPVTYAHTDWRPSGETFAARWDRLDVPARNQLLRDLGARVSWGGGYLTANLRTFERLAEALPDPAALPDAAAG